MYIQAASCTLGSHTSRVCKHGALAVMASMRTSATTGVCSSQHILVDNRSAGWFIDARRSSRREQFHMDLGTSPFKVAF